MAETTTWQDTLEPPTHLAATSPNPGIRHG